MRTITITVDTDDCWLFAKTIDHQGYGRIKQNGKSHSAHRILYEAWSGKIPNRFVVDHLCRVRRCINPDHLEAVTIGENVRRGVGVLPKSHCKNGHKLSGDNVLPQSDGKRKCRTCRRKYDKWYNSNKR